MTEREKEFEELAKLINKETFFYSEDEIGYDAEQAAENIQQAGYTKKHFPVEELKKWVKKERIRLDDSWESSCDFDKRRDAGEIKILVELERIIKEFEDGT